MKKLIYGALLCCIAGVTHAGENLTYEEFIEACKNPDSQGAQIPPTQIKVLCVDEKLRWQPTESGTIDLGQSRLLSAELFSDKYHVDASEFTLEMPEAMTTCPQQREVLETAVVEKPLSCAQVLNEKRGLKEICQEAIDSAIAANPDIVETIPTGKIFSTCEDSPDQTPDQNPDQDNSQEGQ